MRGKGVRPPLREDVQVIVVLRGDLWKKKGIWGGNGGERRGRRREGGSSEKGRRRGGEKRRRRRGEGRRGRGCDAGRGTERRSESERAPGLVDARGVPGQPWEPQHQLEVTQPGHLEGKVLCMSAMDTDAGREVVGDGTSRG